MDYHPLSLNISCPLFGRRTAFFSFLDEMMHEISTNQTENVK